MSKEIYLEQLNALKLIKKFNKRCIIKSIDINISPFCDFVTWADCIGNDKIRLMQKKSFISFSYLKNMIKEIFFVGINPNFKLKHFKRNIKDVENVIYSYCSKKDFNNKGDFYDKYFNFKSSKNSKTLFFLISLDNYLPKKSKNTFILYKDGNYFNFIYFIKKFYKKIFKKNFIHSFNSTSSFSEICANYFISVFKNDQFNLYIPYENRPHQNCVIQATKKISKKNNIFGYYHRAPEPFQLEMIYKAKNLKKLYVSSNIQKKVFIKYFSWPVDKVEVVNSFRYLEFYNRSNFIFFPYKIKNPNFLIDRLNKLQKIKKMSLKNFKISVHPLNEKNISQIDFKNKIKKIIKKNKNIKLFDAPVILGEPGGVAAELLDTVGKVYHICENPLDIFSGKIWNNLEVLKISDSIFQYKKNHNEKFLFIDGNDRKFQRLLKKNNF
jgi:hypothetical protein